MDGEVNYMFETCWIVSCRK